MNYKIKTAFRDRGKKPRISNRLCSEISVSPVSDRDFSPKRPRTARRAVPSRLGFTRASNIKGFTLIELLAVMIILMILMTLIMAVVRDAIKDSRIQKAISEAYEIHNAVEAFFHEYGRMPLPHDDHGKTTGAGGVEERWYGNRSDPEGLDELETFYEILRGNNETWNPKNIVFLKRIASSNKNEPPLRDPWGNPYFVAMDSTYNGQVKTRLSNSGNGNFTVESTVVVRSIGPNGKWDTVGIGRGSDDIITGQEMITASTI